MYLSHSRSRLHGAFGAWRLLSQVRSRPLQLAALLWKQKVMSAFALGCRASREEDDSRLRPFLEKWGGRRPLKRAFRVWRAVARKLARLR